MNQDLGFYLRQDERGDWLYCEDGEERAATLPERVLWKALAAQGVPADWRKALHEAVSAIYFADGSDYLPALRSVVRALSPEISERLETDDREAWETTGDMAAQAQQAAYVPAFRTSLAYDVGFKDGKKAAECVDQFCACRGGPGAECPEGDAVAAQAQCRTSCSAGRDADK